MCSFAVLLKNVTDAILKTIATNSETGETAIKEVKRTFENKTFELLHLTVNGEVITSTPGHKYYAPEKGWTSAIELRAGDLLQLVNGEYVVVEAVQHEILETPVTIYNFEVEDFHTYYVGEQSVLVHNNGCGPDGKADFYVTPDGNVIPTTGYRYMDSRYAEQTMESMSAPGSYFGFEKFDSSSAARDAFQVSPEWSDCRLRGEFDTLQVIDDMYVPLESGGKGPGLEPFTRSYPEFGAGGAQQYKYDGIIHFDDVTIIGD